VNKFGGRGIVAAAFGVGLATVILGVAAPAYADNWNRQLSCGSGYVCAMSSTTTAGVIYWVDSTTKANFPTGGAHSWSGPIRGGSHVAAESTSGHFSAQNASCYCPAGHTCGI